MRHDSYVLAVLALAFACGSRAEGGKMFQPAGATTSMGWYTNYEPAHTIDQSGMAAAYVSGTTDFATYTAATSTLNGATGGNAWFSQANTTTGNFDFNLGSTQQIAALALWPDFQNLGQTVKNFILFADDNAAFSSPVFLGNFTMADGDGWPEAPNLAQVFAFATTGASYIRMQITSNNGSALTTGFSEAAFNVVPEPASLGLMLLGSTMLGRRARRTPEVVSL